MARINILLLASSILTATSVLAQRSSESTGGPELYVTYADVAPKIDGLLDDPIWEQIDPIDNWVQREPMDGAVPTEHSEMRMAYDENNLYFAFHFFDKEPEKIRANIFDRGGRLWYDDLVWIALDTYYDRRNAYLFEMNALGTQDDAILQDEHLDFAQYKWDGVFFSEGAIDEDGWILEVAIPFRTIRFSQDENPLMGIVVARLINRKGETAMWPHISLDYKEGVFQVSQYATLRGLKNLKRGRNIEIKPYIISGAQEIRVDETHTDSEFLRDIGVDLKVGLTSNYTLDLTLNTDFAQVESDNVQLNLSRFSLFFPEKREFFLERAALFQHGASRRAETFFSRRIGITNDILAGARFTGQSGPLSIGLLNIQTKREKELDLAPTNNSVARIQADVLNRSTLGAIFTNLENGDHFNRVVGVDGAIRFFQSSSLEAWFSNVWDSEPDVSDAAGAVNLQFRSDLLSGGGSYTNIGKNYSPALGFVRRRDMIEYAGNGSISPRIYSDQIPVRQIAFTGSVGVIEGQDHRKQTSTISTRTDIIFTQRDRFSVTLSRQFERLGHSFAIRGAEIPLGEYNMNKFSVSASSDPGRKYSFRAGYGSEDFWGGTRTSYNATAAVTQSKYFKVSAGFRTSKITLPVDDGKFSATTVTLNLQGATGRKLFATALMQYDNFSHDVQANVRVDWIHRPGSDLFFVFNTTYNFSDEDDMFDPRSAILNDRVGVAKVTYLVMI